ncbi:MAG: hypothetical protein ACI8XC_003154 [Gammaproteobacteria bacterium]|jgi:hypothetical protein
MLTAGKTENQMVKGLIDLKANLNVRNHQEKNAYQIAKEAEHTETADLIL